MQVCTVRTALLQRAPNSDSVLPACLPFPNPCDLLHASRRHVLRTDELLEKALLMRECVVLSLTTQPPTVSFSTSFQAPPPPPRPFQSLLHKTKVSKETRTEEGKGRAQDLLSHKHIQLSKLPPAVIGSQDSTARGFPEEGPCHHRVPNSTASWLVCFCEWHLVPPKLVR